MFKVLKTYYAFLLKKPFWFTFFVVTIIVAPIAESIFPYFFKLFVDAIPKLDYQNLLRLLIIFITLRAGTAVVESLRFFIGDILTINATRSIRRKVFGHLQDLDFAFHANKSSGSLISAFKRGDGALWDLHFAIHIRILSVFLSFAVMLFFFKGLSSQIFLLAIISFILAMAIAWIFIRVNSKARVTLNEEEDRFTSVIADNMINFETVKLFGKESWERFRLDRRLTSWFKAVWRFVYTFRYLDFAMGILINISIFLILWVTLRQTVAKEIGIGDFVLVATFVGYFYPNLFEMIWGFRDLANKYSDVQKYFGILDNVVEVKDPEKPIKVRHVYGEVNFDNVYFSYSGKAKNAINGLSLKINQGQAVALVGVSGSGKTTLVKLLMRFFDVDSGQISIDGINIKDFNKSTLRSFIGVVPQEPILFNNTIAYNIGYGKSGATLAEIKAASKIANIDGFIESAPEKYQTRVGERGIKLSGGQKQRIAIARMILSDPDIVIFDEATSQLDSESERLIQEAFWKARSGKTTVIIAHRLSTVSRADKIVVMAKGKIKETGSHQELLAKPGSLYKHFWDLQINLD